MQQEKELTAKIRALLKAKKVAFKEVSHAPATTCEESAKARGEEVRIGGKTLLFKDKRDFRLFVISAAKQVDSNKVRKILGSQKLRFATTEELAELCSVEKGALPPFGRDILPFDLYLDQSITENQKIAFNAGDLHLSFIMEVSDYLNLVEAKVCSFAKDPEH
ncbi:MAG: hypothetical protein HN509_07080 [Halobacteriovoraceae bacterium]|jgi:Ala-tRNA(Pro) deacylase|nr:hypothetical protein [Halobacteriovoraceae bacterium]MBT5096090.1 hypothetical protein [Halobacteriovoraceae bacterium]